MDSKAGARNDAELVWRSRMGDRDAFGELIERYQRQMWGLACTLLDDPPEAEDIVQEAFLRAWLNLDLLSDPGKFAPWLRRIVFGVAIDWLRVFRPDLYRSTGASEETALWQEPAQLRRLETIELRERVWQAVARLPPRYRLPLKLFHLDGLSHRKVAEELDIPESTVRSLVTRARRKLGAILKEMDEVFMEQAELRRNLLHITDGESVAGTLRQSGIPGTVAVYGDLMYEGPAPAGLSDEDWRDVRAGFMAEAGFGTIEETKRYLKSCHDALASYVTQDEVVLWVDHRLSDQLILIKALDWFGKQDLGGVKLGLICRGTFPGKEDYVGLGQLTADQLASLADTRQRVSEAQLRLARTAWAGFTSPDPTAIEKLIETDTSELPFLAAALRRHLEQFPSVQEGLSRTERQALAVLKEQGPLTGGRLFVAVQRMEEQIFMGHESFHRMMDELASATRPLVRVKEGSLVEITETGGRVMEGHADHVELNGIDRWLGGVHLKGDRAVWRWDAAKGKLIER